MAIFNRGNYSIYHHKEITGDTPLSPQSPKNECAVSSTALAANARLLATGALMATTVVNVARSQINATTGREDLQNTVNNLMIGVGVIGGLAIGGLPAAAALTIKGAADYAVLFIERTRENYATNLETKLMGKRNLLGSGSVYYG